ncbi:MAG TPA: hypothetical protein VGQ76_03885 [Thermoanaerobaculia bacterium]|nr:hypothetical protein [Thermoanaerobaculia bacterium]
MSRLRFLSAFLGAAVLTFPLLAWQHVNHAKGFNANSVYQFNDYDSINAFNGNLTISIPIGRSFPLAEGAALQLVLHSNGNVWEAEKYLGSNCGSDPGTVAYANRRANAGMGWILSLGRLYHPSDPTVSNTSWTYESPDGADHQFGGLFGQTGGAFSGEVSYTKDGSYLRMIALPANVRTIEFPDGTKHYFSPSPDRSTWWRLDKVTRRSGESSESELYRIDYDTPDTWKIIENGRQHVLTFAPVRTFSASLIPYDGNLEHRMIKSVRFADGATYSFEYETARLGRPFDMHTVSRNCWSTTANVWLLSGMVSPDGTKVGFKYEISGFGGSEPPGLPLSMSLPTGGTVTWTWQTYTKPAHSGGQIYFQYSWGVLERQLHPRGSTSPLKWTYSVGSEDDLSPGHDDPHAPPIYQVTTITDPAGKVTENYFDVSTLPGNVPGHHYGRPFTDFLPDPTGLRGLSQRVLAPNVVGGPLILRQTTYVQYEDDDAALLYGPIVGGRVKSQRVVQNDDGNRSVTTTSDDWDGLGHYRTVTASGTALGNVTRTTTTSYGRASEGIVQIPRDSPWLTALYDSVVATESGGAVGTTSSQTDVCFDLHTGRLLGKRVHRGWGSTRDLYSFFSYDQRGNTTEESFFGGDTRPLTAPLADNCTAPSGAPDYKLTHLYSSGVRRETKYDGVPFKSADLDVDLSTALPITSRDTALVPTRYAYDNMGRVTEMHPSGSAWTQYTYTAASVSAPASVTVAQWKEGTSAAPGSELTLARYHYDGFGRMVQQSRKMPSSWSTSWIEYDVFGREVRETTPQARSNGDYELLPTASKSTRWFYDPQGRVETVRQPDDKETRFSYTGNRETHRTVDVATTEDDMAPVRVIEEVDGFGRLIKVTEDPSGENYVGENHVTEYDYDVGDRLRWIWLDGSPSPARQFDYDGAGLLKSETHPEAGTTTYEYYDARGHATKRTTAVATMTYEYDKAERLTLVKTGAVPFVESQAVKFKEFFFDRANLGDDKSLGKLDRAIRYNRHEALPGGVQTVTESHKYTGPGGAVSAKSTAVAGMTFTDQYKYDDLGAVKTVDYPTCVGCEGLSVPARSVTTTRSQGLATAVGAYANGIAYHPSGMLSRIQHLNSDGTNGPLYEQFQGTSTMARPERIKVSGFCEDLAPSPPTPAQQTVNAGVGFTITLTLPPGATAVQWFERTAAGDVLLNGKTNPALTISAADVTRVYFARVKNDTCSADSATATVNVSTACASPSVTIAMPEEPIANVMTSAAVSPTPGASYAWTLEESGVINGSTTGQTVSFTPGCSGTVKLRVTVTTSCESKSGATPDFAIIGAKASVSGSATIPPGQTTDATIQLALSGLGPWQVLWSDGLSQTVPAATPVITRLVRPATTVTYTITSITDGAACAGTTEGSATVTVATPICTVPPGSDFDGPWSILSSTIESIGALAEPNTSYSWTVTNAQRLTEPVPHRVRFRPGCSGVVTITLTATSTDPACGLSSTTTKVFPIFPAKMVVKAQLTAPNIHVRGDAPRDIKFEAVGVAPTVRWSDGAVQSNLISGGLNQPVVRTRPVQPSETTTYSIVDVRDFFGCSGQSLDSVTVTVCDAPPVEIEAPSIIAASETATASVPALPGATYSWTITGGTLVGSATTPTVTFSPGTSCTQAVALTVTVTTSCGVTRTSTTAVVPVIPTSAAATGTATIAQGSSTEIRATLTGVGPWTVRWNDQQTAQTVTSPTQKRMVTPMGTYTYSVVSATDSRGCAGTISGQAVITVIPPIPAVVSARAVTTSQVAVTWSYSGEADQFVIYRNGAVLTTVTSPAARSYTDLAVAPSNAYVYHLIAQKSSISSGPSAPDLATTVILEDDPLQPNAGIRAQHILQLRTAVTAVRSAAGLTTAAFTDPALVSVEVKAIHFNELRNRLNEARVLLGLAGIGAEGWPLQPVHLIWSTELNALRKGVQ